MQFLFGAAILFLQIWSLIKMSAAFDRLTQEVTETRTAADSAVDLIKGLAEQIRAGAGDEAAMNALADSLDASQSELSAATTENTPAPAEPTPEA